MATTRVQWSNLLNTSKKTIINHRDYDVLQKWVTHTPSPLEIVAQHAHSHSSLLHALDVPCRACSTSTYVNELAQCVLPSRLLCHHKTIAWFFMPVWLFGFIFIGGRRVAAGAAVLSRGGRWRLFLVVLFVAVLFAAFLLRAGFLTGNLPVFYYCDDLPSHSSAISLSLSQSQHSPLSYVMCTADCWWSHVLIDNTTIHNNTCGYFGGGFFGATTQQ